MGDLELDERPRQTVGWTAGETPTCAMASFLEEWASGEGNGQKGRPAVERVIIIITRPLYAEILGQVVFV